MIDDRKETMDRDQDLKKEMIYAQEEMIGLDQDLKKVDDRDRSEIIRLTIRVKNLLI